ncbi:hypothetical protein [Pseudoduganella violaceinigra]|uniref:hypothetical protein n=1 Tax=Pseudoduganella violaceinigra TaxID=246602 RepID=UPI00047F4B02|nr:hypothetical protein [Pseudoduganella violaceinigra]
MKRLYTFRRRLFAPLVYLAALFLIFEEWLWDAGARLMIRLSAFPPFRALERLICGLGPAAAMAVFLLPALMLFPVKLLALFAMARGHAIMGLSVFVLAKIAGAAAVARLYTLTRPSLLKLRWFAWLQGRFLAVKERWVARLKASAAWRAYRALVDSVRERLRRWRAGWRRGRLSARPMRVLRRFSAFWRMRRR